MRPADISAATGLSNNRIFRIISTLCKWEYLEKNPKTNEYLLGPTCLITGEVYRTHRQMLREAAQPIIRDLAIKSGDISNLIVPFLGVYLAQIEAFAGKELIQGKLGLGDTHPMVPYGIVSMFFMATMPEEEKTRLLDHFDNQNHDSKRVIDRNDLESRIESMLNDGYGIADVPWEPGILCITAPIRNEMKKIIAVAALILPESRFTEAEKQQKINLVIDAANQISSRLGYYEFTKLSYFG